MYCTLESVPIHHRLGLGQQTAVAEAWSNVGAEASR